MNFGPTTPGVYRAMEPEVGITSTPVIDLASGTTYVVSESTPGGTTIFQLHALDITNGKEKFNGPVRIQGTVAGIGAGSNDGVLAFDAAMQWQRPGLLLLSVALHQFRGPAFAQSRTSLRSFI